MSSRVRDGFDGVFFGACLEGESRLDRAAIGLGKHGCEGADIAAVAIVLTGTLESVLSAMGGVVYEVEVAGVLTSGGSEDGGSEPMLGLSGVRKGDLNGFFNVFVASFSLRRLACGVDILARTAAFSVM